MSLFKKTTFKGLSTELKMLTESRILDQIDSFQHDHLYRVDQVEPLSLYQQNLIDSKFPKDKYLILHNNDCTYYLMIAKPLDSLDFNFTIHPEKDRVTVQFRHWKVEIKMDYLLNSGLEKDHPLFIKYIKEIQRKISLVNTMEENLNKVYDQFTDEDKLLAEVSDID